jgi:hypothetical protein
LLDALSKPKMSRPADNSKRKTMKFTKCLITLLILIFVMTANSLYWRGRGIVAGQGARQDEFTEVE